MLVNKNINTEKLENELTNFAGIWTKRNGENYITAIGNDFNEVKEEAYFHWAVMADYEGTYKVLPTYEIEWVK
jgi:hypothetical protein